VTPRIRAVGITKLFPGVQALKRVTFEVHPGEIHSLVGENGAGKSTLVKILAGLLRPDAGSLFLDGDEVIVRDPREARRRGITVIPQDIAVVPSMSVGRNVLLGMERFWVRRDRLAWEEIQAVTGALEQAGAAIDPTQPAGEMGISQLRLCQIAKTLVAPGEVFVLDEPSAQLSEADADALLSRLRTLRDEGKAIVYVSHRVNEILRISDRITVLRDGEDVGTFRSDEVTRDSLVTLMAKPAVASTTEVWGQPGEQAETPQPGESVLELRGVGGRSFRGITLTVPAGQVVVVAGVQGAGHNELLRVVAGLLPYAEGEVRVAARTLPPGSLDSAYRAGVTLLPADRRRGGIVPSRSVRDNVVLPPARRRQGLGIRHLGLERTKAQAYVDRLGIRTPNVDTLAGSLSGGNQQKLALARALESDARVLLLEEPTQGIDMGSKFEIRQSIRGMVRTGRRGVLAATSEFEEAIELADVVHVMRLGQVVATLAGGDTTYEKILQHALP
jgi:ABC-type sugar transport system ATPase subunit